MPGPYLTQAEVDALPDGALVEVSWPERFDGGTVKTRRNRGTVWAVSIVGGHAIRPLNRVGAPGTPGAITVRLASDSDEPA